jgi:hypothetical protein
MILKSLTLSLGTLALLSCGQDWEVVTGLTDKSGDPIVAEADPIFAVTPAAAIGPRSVQYPPSVVVPSSARAPSPRRRPVAPRPLQGNPFAVPEVTKELLNEKDLKPSAPTVTAKPPAPAE